MCTRFQPGFLSLLGNLFVHVCSPFVTSFQPGRVIELFQSLSGGSVICNRHKNMVSSSCHFQPHDFASSCCDDDGDRSFDGISPRSSSSKHRCGGSPRGGSQWIKLVLVRSWSWQFCTAKHPHQPILLPKSIHAFLIPHFVGTDRLETMGL